MTVENWRTDSPRPSLRSATPLINEGGKGAPQERNRAGEGQERLALHRARIVSGHWPQKEKIMHYFLWIDWVRRIVSVQEAEGFELLQYKTHQDMLNFAVVKGLDGFGIQ